MALTLNGSTGVVEANIADSAITSSKIASIAASKLTGQVADANAPSGSVIQIVSGYYNTKVRASASSYLWQNAAIITPSSASSKILIIAQFAFGKANLNGGLKLLRNDNPFMPNLISAYQGGTDAAAGSFNTSDDTMGSTSDYEINSYPVFYLDSPNTTSQLSYGLYYYSANTGGTVTLNRQENDNGGNACSTITVMEIAA